VKILILGATGMLGSAVLNYFSAENDFEITATARKSSLFDLSKTPSWFNFDAQNFEDEKLEELLRDCDYVVNCIGLIKSYINDENPVEVQNAIEINSLFPHKLAKIAQNINVKIIQIATDCVYDGVKGNYTEAEKHNALDVYGKTKSLGEVKQDNVMNLRCSIIGLEKKSKTSLLEWFLNQPKNTELKGYLNHFWNGVTTDVFAQICIGIIKSDIKFVNLQHIVPADSVSKAQMLKIFALKFNRNDIKINEINPQIPIDRTIGTNNGALNMKLWSSAGYEKPPTIEEMITNL